MILALERPRQLLRKQPCGSEVLAKRLADVPTTPQGNSAASPYIQALYRTSLLSAQEERCLFERLDELRAHAAELSVLSMDLQCDESAKELRQVNKQIVALRNHIVESNLRLVVSVARKFQAQHVEFHDFVSEGNSILLKAVDLFKIEYGYRFSTYATTALRRGFMNLCSIDHRQKQRFVSGQSERFDGLEDDADSAEMDFESTHDVNHLLEQLDDRERKIVVDRFGLRAGTKAKTFREIGEDFNLSKERIRQILGAALVKMKMDLEQRNGGLEVA